MIVAKSTYKTLCAAIFLIMACCFSALFPNHLKAILPAILALCGVAIYINNKNNKEHKAAENIFSIIIAYYLTAFYITIILSSLLNAEASILRANLALIKSALICLSLASAVLYEIKKGSLPNKPILAFIAITAISAALPVPNIQVKIQYIANSYSALILTTIYLHLILKNNNQIGEIKTSPWAIILVTSIPIALVVSYGLIPEETYRSHQETKGFELYSGYPITWWNVMGDYITPRFPGTSEDPIFYGYIAASISIALYSHRKNTLFWIAALATLLSISKGAIIWLAATIILSAVTRKIKQKSKIYLIAGTVIAYIYVNGADQLNTSANIHIIGLITPLINSISNFSIESIIGHGIGSSGNLLKIYLLADLSKDDWLGGGAESGFGLMIYQIGLAGVFSFTLALISIFKSMQSPTAKCAWMIYWINALMQENLINLNYLTLLTFTIVACESKARKHIELEKNNTREAVNE